jgi:hypothetical protein
MINRYSESMNAKYSFFARFLQWLFTALEVMIASWTTFALVALIRGSLGLKETTGGQFWLGNVGLKLNPEAYHLTSPTMASLTVALDNLFGSIGFKFPAVLPLYRSLLPSLCGIILGRMLVMLILCELFRRLFKSVARREVFSLRNMRGIQIGGVLILLLTLAGPLFERVYAARMIAFFNRNVATQGALAIDWRLPPSTGISAGTYTLPHNFMARIDDDMILFGRGAYIFRFDVHGLLLGLVLVGLGAAFRQGLTLREESELTV